jgi:hypothetical protein
MVQNLMATKVPGGDLFHCGPGLIPAFVRAIERAPLETDEGRLEQLLSYGSLIRDPAILTAAWALIENQQAAGPVRNLGLLFAISEHDPGWIPQGLNTDLQLLTEKLPEFCIMGHVTDAAYGLAHPLPADELHQLYLRASAVLREPHPPKTTRRLAGCIVRSLRRTEERPDYSLIRITYVCANLYDLWNGAGQSVVVSWKVGGKGWLAGGPIPAHGKRRIEADDPDVEERVPPQLRRRTVRVIVTDPVTSANHTVAEITSRVKECS